MVGGGAGAGAECCQLCWLRDDEESWHGDRHGDYRRVTRQGDTTSRAMLTFPIVLVTGETNWGTQDLVCKSWCVECLTLRGFHFLIVLYFIWDLFLAVRWGPSVNASRVELFWNDVGCGSEVSVSAILIWWNIWRIIDSWIWIFHLLTLFFLRVQQSSDGESNKVDIGCWMQNSSPLTRV